MNEVEIKPFTVSNDKKNRKLKRSVLFELERNSEKVFNVEDMFIKQLFEDNNFTYLELYKHHSKNWQSLITWFKQNNRLKYTEVNIEYFNEKYKPLETWQIS